jgi:hypothetical protein
LRAELASARKADEARQNAAAAQAKLEALTLQAPQARDPQAEALLYSAARSQALPCQPQFCSPCRKAPPAIPLFGRGIPSSRPCRKQLPPRAGGVKDRASDRRRRLVLDGAEHGGMLDTALGPLKFSLPLAGPCFSS